MGDYATKGQGTAGVTLGTIGTVGAGLLLLNALNGNCGCGGGLGGLLGGNHNCCQQNQIQQLMAENAQLKSENYADKVGKEVYNQSIRDDKELRTEMFAFIKPIADSVAQLQTGLATTQANLQCCCEKQELREQILAGKINETALALNGKIDTQNAVNKGTFDALNQTIACISGKVDMITRTVVPITAVCPQPQVANTQPAAAA